MLSFQIFLGDEDHLGDMDFKVTVLKRYHGLSNGYQSGRIVL